MVVSSNQSPLHLMVLLGIYLHTTLLLDLLSLNIFMDEEISFPTIINNEIGPTILTLVESMLGTPLVFLEGLTISGKDRGRVITSETTVVAWSCFEKILHEHQRAQAPRVVMVSLRTDSVLYLSSIDCRFGSFSSKFFFVWLCLDRKKMKENNKDFWGFIFIFLNSFLFVLKIFFFFFFLMLLFI